MGTPWFKFYGGEYLYDPKIMSLTAPDRSCWVSLLCYASVSEIPGEIKHLTEERLLIASGIDTMDDLWSETQGVLQRLVNLEMITIDDNGMITVKNFRKRQDSALTSYERVKKYREKKRLDNADNDNDNARVDKRRVDKINYSAKADYRANPKLPDAEETKQLIERLKK